jgi:phage gp29-like protein
MLINQYGKEIKKGRPVLDEVGVIGIRDRHSTYPSQGLTPERLASIFREADAGDITRQAELFEEMEEKDAHLASVLQTRKLAVAGLDWEVVAVSEEEEDRKVAELVREALAGIENFDDAVVDLLDAIGKGFSVSEIMWELAEGRIWPKEIKWRHQKKFTFLAPLLDKGGAPKTGVVDFPRLITDAQPVYGEDLTPNKFIVHRYRSRSGMASRGGVLRPCAYMYLFKNYTVKDWVIFNERFAMPMRVGKFSASTSEADRKVLRNAVFNLGSDAAAVISDSTVIELLEQSGRSESGGLYERLCEFCDRSVSKAVLGQTLTSEQAQGTYATAKVHQTVRQDLLEADAKALAKTIQMQLVRPLVEYNFGPGKGLPAFRFHYREGEDLKVLAETFNVLASLGMEIPKAYLHKRFGIPMKEEK